ncbi:MAG: hypothetical protein ACI9YE_000892 [Psychroserpens sp.]|jgi:hypothetical protein
MKKQLIQKLFEQFEQAGHNLDGLDCWSARELQNKLKKANKLFASFVLPTLF